MWMLVGSFVCFFVLRRFLSPALTRLTRGKCPCPIPIFPFARELPRGRDRERHARRIQGTTKLDVFTLRDRTSYRVSNLRKMQFLHTACRKHDGANKSDTEGVPFPPNIYFSIGCIFYGSVCIGWFILRRCC